MREIAEIGERCIVFSNVVVGIQHDGKPRKIELRFLNSYRFIESNLDKLTSNLVEVNYLKGNCS